LVITTSSAHLFFQTSKGGSTSNDEAAAGDEASQDGASLSDDTTVEREVDHEGEESTVLGLWNGFVKLEGFEGKGGVHPEVDNHGDKSSKLEACKKTHKRGNFSNSSEDTTHACL
jgi:hypothetical protein